MKDRSEAGTSTVPVEGQQCGLRYEQRVRRHVVQHAADDRSRESRARTR